MEAGDSLAVAFSGSGERAPVAGTHERAAREGAMHEAGALTRRGVLAGAAAVAGVAALGPLVSPPPPPAIHLAITDPRFERARLFLEGIGPVARRIAAGPDLCRQWYDSIRSLVAGRPFAGVTTWIDFLVLQGCAREQGLICSRHCVHAPSSPGDVSLVSFLFVPRAFQEVG